MAGVRAIGAEAFQSSTPGTGVDVTPSFGTELPPAPRAGGCCVRARSFISRASCGHGQMEVDRRQPSKTRGCLQSTARKGQVNERQHRRQGRRHHRRQQRPGRGDGAASLRAGRDRRARRAARRAHRGAGRRADRARAARRSPCRPTSPTASRSRRLVDAAVQSLRPHRRDDQQRRADAALAARAPEGRRLGPDDRRQHQGRALRHRRGAAAHEASRSPGTSSTSPRSPATRSAPAAPSMRRPSTPCARSPRACGRR